MTEYNEETHVAISRETFDQFKGMGQQFLSLKKELREKEETISLFKLNFELIFYCVIRFTGTFGLNNEADNMIHEDILSGEKNPISGVMKSIMTLMKDGMLAETNPAAKARLEDKFKFFLFLKPVAEFYQLQKKIKAIFKPEELSGLPETVKTELLK